MAITQQQGMDLATSFGPTLLAGLLAGNTNKVDKAARARNDLANLLEVGQNSANYGGQIAQQQFQNLFDTRQTMGQDAVNNASKPYDLMATAQKARLRGAIGPQLAAMFGQTNVNLPSNAFDIYNRMGSDEMLGQQLNQMGEGMSMQNPLGTPLNLSTLAGPTEGQKFDLNAFNNTRRNEFTSGESNLNNALANAVAGYQGAANDYKTGLQNLQKSESSSSGGGSIWKKLLGIGALAAIPFTGGLSSALAGATGLGSAASAGLVGAGLGAASSAAAGSNPLLGAVMGGAGGSLFGPGGKFGTTVPSYNTDTVKKVASQVNATGQRNALSSIYNTGVK